MQLRKLTFPVIAVALAVTACGGDDSPSVTETPSGDEAGEEASAGAADAENTDDSDEAAEGESEGSDGEEVDAVALYSAIAEATVAEGSFEFETSSDVGGEDVSVTGAIQLGTDMSESNMRMTSQAMGVETTILIVDGQFYMEMSEGMGLPAGQGSWMTVDPAADDAFSQQMTDSFADIGSVTDDLDNMTENPDTLTVTQVGTADIDGVATTEYHVVVEDIAAFTDSADDTISELSYSMWVGDDNLIRRVVADVDGSVSTETNYFNYGVDVEVEAPPADEVTDLREMMNQ